MNGNSHSTGGEDGVASVMMYLLVYTFMKLGIFAVVISFKTASMKGEHNAGELISDYSGLSKHHSVLALLMLLFLFSLTSIPPTAGFMAKLVIIVALVKEGYIFLAVAAVLFSSIAAFFYLRIVILMYMRDSDQLSELNQPLAVRFTLATTGIATLGIGLFPAWFLALATASVL